MGGYFGIGVMGAKNGVNIGTLWRNASLMGAAYIFTVGRRYKQQSSDTVKSWRHVPLYDYPTFEDFRAHIPFDCRLVGVELVNGARDLPAYTHPPRAVYLLGAEDNGLPDDVLDRCHNLVSIPSVRSLNVATAGSIVVYDRVAKLGLRTTRFPVKATA